MSAEQFSALESDILENGCYAPIIVNEEMVIIVSLKEGHSVRVVQDALFRSCGLTPNILLETDSLEVARRTALGTGSCMLCSNIYVDDLVRRYGAFYPLKDYQNHRHFYACYPKDERIPRYASEFIQIVVRVLRQKRF